MKNQALSRIGLLAVLIVFLTDVILTLTTGIYSFILVSDRCIEKATDIQLALSRTVPYINIDDIENEEIMRKTFPEYIRNLFLFSEAKYLYMFRASHEEDKITYVFAVAADDEENERVSVERSRGTVVDIGKRKYVDLALDGAVAGPEREKNEFGEVWAFYFPIYDKNGIVSAIVGVDFDVTTLRSSMTSYVVRIVLITNSVMILVLALLLFILRKKVFSPIKKLSVQMKNFDPEKKHESLKLSTYHEIEEIQHSFDQMSEDITGYIDNLRKMTEERSQAAAELNIARRIQIGMVPQRLSLTGEGYDIFAFAEPAKEVGGDFYDCFELDGRVCIVIADVSGKGIAAALFLAMAMNMIRGRLRAGTSPAEVLNAVNDEICAVNPENMFVTVFAALLDPSTGELRYANAGHTRPLMICGDQKEYLNPDPGFVLGLYEDAGILEEYTMLSSGSVLLLYTDGITEALNPQRTLFGEQRLLEAAEAGSAEQTAASVTEAVKAYSAECVQSDDITLVAVRFTPHEKYADTFLPPDMKALSIMQSRLTDIAGNNAVIRKIALACEEILVNIISYSGADKIRMTLGLREDRLTMRFEDNGRAFDPFKEIPEEKEFSECDCGGLGIRMVTQLADRTSYARISERNITGLTFLIRQPEQ